ncbi:MAG TPA: LacI family DNA-binding transcriptional regulator [Streptosporangiaceae bacterium]
MKRPTIADVASRAGVTKAAVSFALNGQPGVSESTRQRILAIAAELGFQPSSAARALADGKAGAFGLVIDRPPRTLGGEPFFIQLLAGMQAELSRDHVSLLFTMAEDQAAEIELYRTWWAQRRVDGVFLVDLQLRDQRIAVLHSLRMPAVAFGSPRGSGGLPVVWQDDVAGVETIVAHLADLGHQRIARVGGIPRYWHTRLRTDAFAQVSEAAGIEAISVESDYTREHGADATRDLLRAAAPPTAIVYDNDLMAVAGLSAAKQLGVDVPADLSVVAWDDSVLCELVHPPITALRRDIVAIGAEGARLLRSVAAGGPGQDLPEPAPELVVRESTGVPRQAVRALSDRPASPRRYRIETRALHMWLYLMAIKG